MREWHDQLGWGGTPGPLGLGIAHRRGGYRDRESQAFIESWFGKLKEREVWRSEYETLEEARAGIGAYVERYNDRPHLWTITVSSPHLITEIP